MMAGKVAGKIQRDKQEKKTCSRREVAKYNVPTNMYT
jgi:hypothetical protein